MPDDNFELIPCFGQRWWTYKLHIMFSLLNLTFLLWKNFVLKKQHIMNILIFFVFVGFALVDLSLGFLIFLSIKNCLMRSQSENLYRDETEFFLIANKKIFLNFHNIYAKLAILWSWQECLFIPACIIWLNQRICYWRCYIE